MSMEPKLSPTPASPAVGRREMTTSDQLLRWSSRNARILAPMITLIGMFIFFSFATNTFLSVDNLVNVVTQIGYIAVAAAGITFVLLCGEIDLGIASVATFVGTLAAWFWVNDVWGHN